MGMRVLIVDEDPPTLTRMEYLLRAFGHSTVTARDGEEGIARAARERPDIILMDLQMAKLDGFEAALRIRKLPNARRVPIVAVTADARVGDRARILPRGFDGYIAKPITPETFVAQVESFVQEPTDPREPPR